MINKKKTGMSDEQKLLPQLIYRINSILSDIESDLKEEPKFKRELFLAANVLDSYTRRFNWLTIANNRWQFDSNKRAEIEKFFKDTINCNNWKDFKLKFNNIKIKSVIEAIDIIENIKNKKDELLDALLTLYQFYPHNSEKYIDGIIYRNLKRRANDRKVPGESFKIDYAFADLLIEETGTYKLYPWAKVDFYNNGTCDEFKYSCQENNRPYYPEEPNNPDVDSGDQIEDVKTEDYYRYKYPKEYKYHPTPANVSNNRILQNYLLPLFADYDGFDPKKFLVLSREHIIKFQFIYIIPVYDALFGKYGNLCTILQIPFKTNDERKDFISKVGNTLISRLPSLVNEIKNAALLEILKQPIEDDDLLEHYVKWLPMLQDWEKVMVWKIKEDKSGAEICYCYTRIVEGDKETKWCKWALLHKAG